MTQDLFQKFASLASGTFLEVDRDSNFPAENTVSDILDDSYESDLTDEEHERLILMSEHAIAKPLSPAAQAVFHAFNSKFDWVEDGVPGPQFNSIAAALRAAALHLHAEEVETCGGASYALVIEVDDLIAIADELEAQ